MKIIKPTIILVRPQLPENIGMVARGMDNCGLEKLILIEPREKWPNKLSLKTSANSKKILLNAKIFESLKKALSSFNFVVATSNRKRYLQKPFIDDEDILFKKFPPNKKIAILFGPENSGLSNEDLMLSDIIYNIDTAKSNTSLNLSHAVVLMSYAWRNFFILKNKKVINDGSFNNLASKKDFLNFMEYLKKQLVDVNFLYPESKTKHMFENIQSMFMRSKLSKAEVMTLWGMIKKLRK